MMHPKFDAATIIEDALTAYAAGICVVPPKEDGSKAPFGGWERWQRERPSLDLLRRWYGVGRTGMGFVCGRVSGNLELFEFEFEETYLQFKAIAMAAGLGSLIEHIEAGYLERSPGGGIHWFIHCEMVSGNTKLARRPKRTEEMKDANDTVQTVIETRGEGGYAIVAPSHGRVHPSGKPYVLLRGGVDTIATITPEERESLWELARTFDQMPKEKAKEPPSFGKVTNGATRPGDDFNQRANWPEILQPHGWQRVIERGEVTHWRRPGKDRGISATTNYAGSDLLYVFSTSTVFEPEKGYSKFAAYTFLNHGGDFAAAARALSSQGFGTPSWQQNATGQDVAMAFPLEVLPPPVRTLVEEGARSLVTPPEFIALPLLVSAGSAIGDAYEIQVKPGWREGPNLYAGIVGDPGSKKTPSIDIATHGLRKLQAQASDAYERAMNTYLRELAQWEEARKGDRGERPTPPVFQHFLTTDATTEALAPMLKGSKGVLLVREELAGWVRSMDQYRSGRGADRQHYLSMWSRQGIKVDRKTAPPIIVEKPHLCVLGGIQPDLLPALGDAAQREDGFLDRLLFAYPDPVPDHWTEDGIQPETVAALDALFERLADLHKKAPMFGDPVAVVVRFSPPALDIWRAWYEDHSAEVQDEAFSQRLRGPWAKMPAQLLRLCLILHVLWALGTSDEIPEEVSAETISMACDLIDYFKSHARRVYRQLRRTERSLHLRILEALKLHGEVNMRFLLHDVFKRNMPSAKVRAALEELEESGLITNRTEPGTGGRPAMLWRLA